MKYENDFELAAAYVPHLRYDKAEPFALQGIGYTIYHGTAKSPSCRRVIEIPEGKTAIEYAFYYDFDIQHLYDLEHSFGWGGKCDRRGEQFSWEISEQHDRRRPGV